MNAKTKTLKRPLTAFVFDTSVLIHDSDAYKSMDEHYVVIPMAVFEELDDLKNKHGVASVARKVSVDLEQFVQQKGAFTFPGVSLGKGKGKLSFFIARDLHPEVKKLYSQDCADNRIISTALFLKEELCHEKKRKQNNVVQVVLVSNDVILRAKAVALGLAAESYLHDAVDVNSMYTGIEEIQLSGALASQIYQPGGLSYDNVGEYLGKSAPIPYPYEFFVIKGDSHENHLSYYDPNKGCILKIPESCKDVYKSAVHTRSYEQEFAMWALLNPDIKLVTLSGIAGTGKTMLAIAAAIRQKDAYSQIMLSKPIVGVSDKDIGFLPGDAEDKVAPFMQSFYDQMNFLDRVANSNVGKSEIAGLKESKQLEIVPLVYIRGRSFPGTFLIVDEAQNLNPTEAKAFVTRLDEQSKVVLIGDTGQIDSRYLNKSNNGLSVTIQAFRDCDFAASITLHKVERSHLADWAATHM